jgi:hypothetical protein
MSETKRVNMLNVNPLVIEVEEVVKKGLNKILVNFMDRYELLENTHKQIMQLPSIRQELNKNPYESDSEYDLDEAINFKNNNMYDRSTVESLEYRLDKLEKKYDTMIPILDKIMNKIISLDQEVKSLKICENISPIKPSTCKMDEKENIKIHFEEPGEELVEEESDEEDVNPALITCSTITFNKESAKVEEKLEKKEQEEDHELSVGEELGEHEDSKVEVKIPDILYRIVPAEELFPDEDLEADVKEEVEAESEDNVDGDVESESEAKTDDNLAGDVEEEASIETETKSAVEDDDVEQEEQEQEPEPVKQIVEEKQPPEEEDDEELFEIEIDDKTYCTNDDQNGFIWELTEDGDQGVKIGYLKDGDAYFYEDEN